MSEIEDYIRQKLDRVKFGEVQFTVKRYDNKDVAIHAYESHSYKPGAQQPSVDIAEYILHKIKEYSTKNHKGTVTFSVIFKESPQRVIMNVVEQND